MEYAIWGKLWWEFCRILYHGTATHISVDKDSEVGINDMIAVNQGDNIFSYKIKYTAQMCYIPKMFWEQIWIGYQLSWKTLCSEIF